MNKDSSNIGPSATGAPETKVGATGSASACPNTPVAHLSGTSRRPRWPWIVLGVIFLAMTAHMVRVCIQIDPATDDDDYYVHRVFGQRFLTGELAASDGICFNYMPISALYWSPLALMPLDGGRVVSYLFSLAALALTLYLLSKMVRPSCDPARWAPLPVAALTVVLCGHYLLRDMGDGGPHVFLLTMIVAGIYLASRGKEKWSALWFGLAIALKMTPALFLPIMLWKRKWRLACYTVIATLLWVVLPSVRMGWNNWWLAQQSWNEVATNSLMQHETGWLYDNNTRVQNQALKPAILRYLVTYPPGHILRLNHPADVPVLNLSQALAGRIATAIMLALVLLCAWQSRHPYSDPADPAWLLESSGTLILVLLFAPLVWLQHVVFIVPAVYLLVAHDWCIQKLPRPAAILLWAYIVMALVLLREVVGKGNYLLLLSYHMHTLCMLIILGLLLWVRPVVSASASWPARSGRSSVLPERNAA